METFSTFLRTAGIVFSALILLVAAVNYHYDPANLFGDRTYEAGVARLLSEGKNVANLTDYDERLVQKFFVERLTSRRDVLVLGSSRSMNIGPDIFPDATFYNASVSGASLEDDYAILQLYREHDLLPKVVVLGVDPWLFNRNSGQTRWKSLEEEFRRSQSGNSKGKTRSVLVGDQRWSRLFQLVNIDYFYASLKSVGRANRGYYETNAAKLDVNVRHADGTIAYGREYAQRSSEEVAEIARQQAAKGSVYSLDKFSGLDSEYARQLETLIGQLQTEGIMVILFLAPYQPDMYAVLARAGSPYHGVEDSEMYLRRVAQQYHLPLLGSYDPRRTSCGRGDFYDEMHPRPACVAKLFAGLQPSLVGLKRSMLPFPR